MFKFVKPTEGITRYQLVLLLNFSVLRSATADSNLLPCGIPFLVNLVHIKAAFLSALFAYVSDHGNKGELPLTADISF